MRIVVTLAASRYCASQRRVVVDWSYPVVVTGRSYPVVVIDRSYPVVVIDWLYPVIVIDRSYATSTGHVLSIVSSSPLSSHERLHCLRSQPD